ncbi:MAG TPA: hydrogenase formation protein HypD [Patescibacteria group bacterium]|nr:hydrogenase formation protein HypD [Patescibacteria group bacterium]
MKYIDEFRNQRLIKKISERILALPLARRRVRIMEVCGTHTQAFFRFGLKDLLPGNFEFISGPGCPVCVSSQEYIDKAIAYAQQKDTVVATFADMLRVPGTHSSLEKEKARSARVVTAYSALDALDFSRKNPRKRVVFLAVGFETTAPTIALSLIRARQEKLKNLFFFSSLKLIPPVMRLLLKDQRLRLSAFLCPGHVSAIIGSKAYDFIPRVYGIPCCVAGFEPMDIMEGVYSIARSIIRRKPSVMNQYSRVVTGAGNRKALGLIDEVFKTTDAAWRGLGRVASSGLSLRDAFAAFDIEKVAPLKLQRFVVKHPAAACRCGDVLKGLIRPDECALFKTRCSPASPWGPCMVSSEGACSVYYAYA